MTTTARTTPPATPPSATATTVTISWDRGLLSRFALDPVHAGRVTAGYTTSADGKATPIGLGSDTSAGPFGNATERAIAQVFVDRVARNDAALRELRSNAQKPVAVRGGEFQLVLDRPGSEPDLVYAGVLKAVPQPIADIIAGARELRRYV